MIAMAYGNVYVAQVAMGANPMHTVRTFQEAASWPGPSLIIAYSTFNLPFAFWLMMSFFEDLPIECEEAALVDGCTWFGTFWNVALPQARPGLVATGVLALVFAWNDFAFATAFTSTGTQTVPVAASLLISQQGIKWGQAMAIGTMIIAPMLAAGVLVRRHLVRGLSMGAIK